MIYISIRSSFHPNMGPGLTFWSERLFHQHITVKHTWDSCLSYAIAYFQKHQNSIPESWYLVDSKLHVNSILRVISHPLLRALILLHSCQRNKIRRPPMFIMNYVTTGTVHSLVVHIERSTV